MVYHRDSLKYLLSIDRWKLPIHLTHSLSGKNNIRYFGTPNKQLRRITSGSTDYAGEPCEEEVNNVTVSDPWSVYSYTFIVTNTKCKIHSYRYIKVYISLRVSLCLKI